MWILPEELLQTHLIKSNLKTLKTFQRRDFLKAIQQRTGYCSLLQCKAFIWDIKSFIKEYDDYCVVIHKLGHQSYITFMSGFMQSAIMVIIYL